MTASVALVTDAGLVSEYPVNNKRTHYNSSANITKMENNNPNYNGNNNMNNNISNNISSKKNYYNNIKTSNNSKVQNFTEKGLVPFLEENSQNINSFLTQSNNLNPITLIKVNQFEDNYLKKNKKVYELNVNTKVAVENFINYNDKK